MNAFTDSMVLPGSRSFPLVKGSRGRGVIPKLGKTDCQKRDLHHVQFQNSKIDGEFPDPDPHV